VIYINIDKVNIVYYTIYNKFMELINMAFFEAIESVYDALQIATSSMDEKTKQNK